MAHDIYDERTAEFLADSLRSLEAGEVRATRRLPHVRWPPPPMPGPRF
jgi:hypothetical protein